MNKKRRHLKYDDFLNEQLKDNKFALAYLKESMNDEDERIFLLALKQVLSAQGENISQLAEDAKINREHLYRIFSKRGNPTYTKLKSILKNVGLRLTVEPYELSKK